MDLTEQGGTFTPRSRGERFFGIVLVVAVLLFGAQWLARRSGALHGAAAPVANGTQEDTSASPQLFFTHRLPVLARNDASTLFTFNLAGKDLTAATVMGRVAVIAGDSGTWLWRADANTADRVPDLALWHQPAAMRGGPVAALAGELVEGRAPLDPRPSGKVYPALALIATNGAITTPLKLGVQRRGFAIGYGSARQLLIVGGTQEDANRGIRYVEIVQWDGNGNMTVVPANPTIRAYFKPRLVEMSPRKFAVVGSEGPDERKVGAEVFDFDTQSWSPLPALLAPHVNATVLAARGGLLVLSDSAEWFDPETGAWRFLPLPDEANRNGAAAIMLDERRMLLVGGNDSLESQVYDFEEQAWSAGPKLLATHRNATLLKFDDGSVGVVGGQDVNGKAATSLELLSPAGLAPRYPLGEPGWSTVGAQYTLLADGRVLVTGGMTANGRRGTNLAEVLNPDTHRATTTTSLITPRMEHTALRLADGSVFVIGGRNFPGFDSPAKNIAAERFDPVTRQWTAVPGLDQAQDVAQLAVIARKGGAELLGFESGARPQTEWSSPVAQRAWKWTRADNVRTPLPPPPGAREQFSAVELADGRIALVGGVSPADRVALEPACPTCPDEYVAYGESAPSASSDVLDADLKHWSAGPAAQFPGGAALRLRDGRVLKVAVTADHEGRTKLQGEVADKEFTRWTAAGSVEFDLGNYDLQFRLFDMGGRVAVFVDSAGGTHAYRWSAQSGELQYWPQGDTVRAAVALDDSKLLVVPYPKDYRSTQTFELMEFP